MLSDTEREGLEGVAEEFGAAGAGADDAEANAVVGAEDVGRGERAGESGGDFADKITARLHERAVLLVGDSFDYTVGEGRGWR